MTDDSSIDPFQLSGFSGQFILGFLRGKCSTGGGNWGTLRIPREDWGTLGNIRND